MTDNKFLDSFGLSTLLKKCDGVFTKNLTSLDSIRKKLPVSIISGNWTNTIDNIYEENLGQFSLINMPLESTDDKFNQMQLLVNYNNDNKPHIRIRNINSDSFDFSWTDIESSYFELKKDSKGNPYLVPKQYYNNDGELTEVGIVSNTFISAGGIGEGGGTSGGSYIIKPYTFLGDAWFNDELNHSDNTVLFNAGAVNDIWLKSIANEKSIGEQSEKIRVIEGKIQGINTGIQQQVNKNTENISKHEARITANENNINLINSKLYWDIKSIKDSTGNDKYYLIPKSDAKIKNGDTEINVGELGIVSNTFISAGGIGEGSAGGNSGLIVKGINDLDRTNLNDDRSVIFNTGAVNTVYDKVLTNESDIQAQKELIQDNSQEITNIKNQIGNLDSGLSEKVKANEEAIAKHETRLDSIEPQLYWEEGTDDKGNPYLIPKKKTITTEGTEEIKEVGIVSNTFISAGGVGENGSGGGSSTGASTLGELVNVKDTVDEINTNEQSINVLVQNPNATHWTKTPLTYTHIQNIASDKWIIEHNMNRYPAVTVIDSFGSQIIGDIQYNSKDQLIIYFSCEFSGIAELR